MKTDASRTKLYREIVSDYPGTDAAAEAQSRLDGQAPKALSVPASQIPTSTSRGKETFFDGKVFDPENPAQYLKSLSIKRAEIG